MCNKKKCPRSKVKKYKTTKKIGGEKNINQPKKGEDEKKRRPWGELDKVLKNKSHNFQKKSEKEKLKKQNKTKSCKKLVNKRRKYKNVKL